MRLRSHLMAALLVLCCTPALPCAADVLKITIDGPIHPIAEEYIARAIAVDGKGKITMRLRAINIRVSRAIDHPSA